MKITIVQSDIVWADPAANCERLSNLIDKASGSDLYVLPEMFSTGFATQPEGIAEREGRSLDWMLRKAAETGAAICGSVAVEADGFRNRFYFVKPDGSVTHYDKRHLFTYGGEHKRFTRGEERVVVEWQGVRILLCVCYDLRFPVWSRNLASEPYDMILYVASWPETRRGAWDALLRARAIENQCFVAAVNRVGTDPACRYNGGSCVIDAYGKTIAECADGEETTATVELDLEELVRFRGKFPVLADGDLKGRELTLE